MCNYHAGHIVKHGNIEKYSEDLIELSFTWGNQDKRCGLGRLESRTETGSDLVCKLVKETFQLELMALTENGESRKFKKHWPHRHRKNMVQLWVQWKIRAIIEGQIPGFICTIK